MNFLVVDDSRGMRMMVKRTLRQSSVAIDEVVEAGNGEEGLEKLESFIPDVILSDWNMPEMNGHEFLKNVRASYPDLPFGVVTSQVSDEIKKRAREAGADFFLTKPFTPDGFDSVLQEFE